MAQAKKAERDETKEAQKRKGAQDDEEDKHALNIDQIKPLQPFSVNEYFFSVLYK